MTSESDIERGFDSVIPGGNWGMRFRAPVGNGYDLYIMCDGRRYTYGITTGSSSNILQKDLESGLWNGLAMMRLVFNGSGTLIDHLRKVTERDCGLSRVTKQVAVGAVIKELT
jgi:hypothetical protein